MTNWNPNMDEAPRDKTKIELWHQVHNIVVAAEYVGEFYTEHPTCVWWAVGTAQAWPEESFSHWREASKAPPKETS